VCFIESTYCIHKQLLYEVDCFIELTDNLWPRRAYYGPVIVGCVLLSQHIVFTSNCYIELTVSLS